MPKQRVYRYLRYKSRLKFLPIGTYAVGEQNRIGLIVRYDLLCIEGLARALRIFLQKDQPPTYTLSNPAQLQEVFVESSVGSILY